MNNVAFELREDGRFHMVRLTSLEEYEARWKRWLQACRKLAQIRHEAGLITDRQLATIMKLTAEGEGEIA